MDEICKVKWEGTEEARAAVRNAVGEWREHVRHVPWKSHCELARECVAANTYRAFHGVEKPSRLFRGWAFLFLQSGRFLKLVAHPGSFDREHSCIISDFREYWKCAAEKDLHYGRATKLLNLLVRDACEAYLVGAAYDKIANYIHVPLDECVLKAVRSCVEEDLKKAGFGALPGKLSMGVIQNENQYKTIQNSIRSLTKAVDAPPIVVDYLAWVKTHQKAN